MSIVQVSPPPKTIDENEILTARPVEENQMEILTDQQVDDKVEKENQAPQKNNLMPQLSTSNGIIVLGNSSSTLLACSKSVNSYHSIENNDPDQHDSNNSPVFTTSYPIRFRNNIKTKNSLAYSITSSESESALNKKLSSVMSNSELDNTECLTYEMVQKRLKRNKRQRISSQNDGVTFNNNTSSIGSGTHLEHLLLPINAPLNKLSLSDNKNCFPEPCKCSALPQMSHSRTSPNNRDHNCSRSISPAQHLAKSRENLNQSLNFKSCIQNPKTAPLLESVSISEVSDNSGFLGDISTNDVDAAPMVNTIFSNTNFNLIQPVRPTAVVGQNVGQHRVNIVNQNLRDSGLNSEISGAFSCNNGSSPRIFSIGGIKKDRCVSPLIANESNVKVVHNKIRPPSSKKMNTGCPELAESISIQTKTQVITPSQQRRRASVHQMESRERLLSAHNKPENRNE